MQYTCAIIGKKLFGSSEIERLIAQMDLLRPIGKFTSEKKWGEKNLVAPDIIFVDLDLLKTLNLGHIKSLAPHSNLILISKNDAFALRAYREKALDFLLKPISFERFYRSIIKVQKLQKGTFQKISENVGHIYFRESKNKMAKIAFEAILFVLLDDTESFIYLENRTIFTHYGRNFWRDILPLTGLRKYRPDILINKAHIL